MTQFTKKKIDLKFEFGLGQNGEQGSETVEVKGLRCSASITRAGGLQMPALSLRIWGLSQSLMNRLTILNQLEVQARRNKITVMAGDDEGMAFCFAGIITLAWADFEAAPETSFVITAHAGYLEALKPVPPTSFNGSVSASIVAASIAGNMGKTLQDSGVTAILSDPYLPGDLRSQLDSIATAANFDYELDDLVVAIWPKGGARGTEVPLISKDTGMVGYPSFGEMTLMVSTLYNPVIMFGSLVKVESVLTPATGFWRANSVTHDLEAEMPGGKWYTHLSCNLCRDTLQIRDAA